MDRLAQPLRPWGREHSIHQHCSLAIVKLRGPLPLKHWFKRLPE